MMQCKDHARARVRAHLCMLGPIHQLLVKRIEALKEFSVLNFPNNGASYLDSAIVSVYSDEAKWSDEVCHCRPVWVFSDSLA